VVFLTRRFGRRFVNHLFHLQLLIYNVSMGPIYLFKV
jgi:hypothetical protein